MSPAATAMHVQTLVVEAQRAFRLLVPIANTLGVHWREPHNYDDWDIVASGIFGGFVLEAIQSSTDWNECAPLVSYDNRVVHYERMSFVAVGSNSEVQPFICFETSVDPFDICLLADIDSDLRVKGEIRRPFSECHFVAVGQKTCGKRIVLDSLTW